MDQFSIPFDTARQREAREPPEDVIGERAADGACDLDEMVLHVVRIGRERAIRRAVLGEVPPGLTLVPMDFENERIADALARNGYRNDQPVFFVWEAVTQYLTEEAVRATFDFLAQAPVGSELVFTFVRKDFLDGTEMFGGEAAYREFVLKRRMWKFGLLPGEVEGFLAPFGWEEREQLGPHEYAERYLEPACRPLPVSEIERAVHCVKVTA